jgi:hypothetical protein
MSTVSSDQILTTLRQARDELEQDYLGRKSAIDQAIAAFGEEPVTLTTRAQEPHNGSKRDLEDLSIGSDKLNRVRQVLRTSTNGRLRQADITKKAKLNSGTVSVALRKLEQADEVRSTGEKLDGSMVWEEIRPTAASGSSTDHFAI